MTASQNILIVGSVAFDDVETPAGHRPRSLGGSAQYFSIAASHFCPIRLVAVVGEDFPQEQLALLEMRGIDLEGLEQSPGQTFYWRGRYGADWGDAETLDTQLNVFEHFQPKIPAAYQQTPYLFLGNIHPALQGKVLDQIERPKLVGADTMNLWIDITRDTLLELIARLDLFIIK